METKTMKLKKLLSKRVIRNTKGFGWHLYDATDVSETTTWVDSVEAENIYDNKWKLTPHYNSETKYFIMVTFYRKNEWFKNLRSVKVLEFFYNLIMILRRIIGALLPLMFVVAMGVTVAFSSQNNGEAASILATVFGISFSAWLLFMLLEDIFSAIARGILKPATGNDAAARVQSDGSVVRSSGYGNDISTLKKIFLSVISIVIVVAGILFGGAIGDAIALKLTESGAIEAGSYSILSSVIALVGAPIVLFLLVVTIIKIWKAKTSRMLFMLLDLVVSAAFMMLLMITQV